MEPILPGDEEGKDLSELSEAEETVRDFIALQHRELELKHAELEASKHEVENNRIIAEKSIDAQARDGELRAQVFNKSDSRRIRLMGFALASVLFFLVFSILMDETKFAEDVVKLIIGGVAGYFVGKNDKGKSSSSDS